jgi:hypothetical protein
MGLSNFIVPGSYAAISSAQIDRNYQGITFTIDVFTDNTKTSLLFSKQISFLCMSNYKTVTDAFRLEPNGTEADGDYYWIPIEATGEWAQFAGKYLQYLKQGTEVTQLPHEPSGGDCFLVPSGACYRINPNKTLTQQIVGSATIWDTFFDFPVSTAPNTNLIKQCYEFLKTTHLYQGASEA